MRQQFEALLAEEGELGVYCAFCELAAYAYELYGAEVQVDVEDT
jgi:hypothetical protein